MKCFQFVSIEDNVCCGFVIYGFYYVDVCAFYACFLESFHHKWVLNFVKDFLCIYGDNNMVFIFQFVNLLQYSYLENPMDRGTWKAPVHKVAKSQTLLKSLSMHAFNAVRNGFI